MSECVDLYDSTYRHFGDQVAGLIRKAVFGEDIRQNSWVTVDEYDRFIACLGLAPDHHILEIASGSGGPGLHLARNAGCRVTGIDANESAVATASRLAERSNEAERVRFRVADATGPLPFEDGRRTSRVTRRWCRAAGIGRARRTG